MPQYISLANCHTSALNQMLTIRFLFRISCISFAISIVWIQCVSKTAQPALNDNLVEEALQNVARDFRYTDVYRKTSRLPKDLKYILLWTRRDFAPFYYLGQGQLGFLNNNCSVINCYVTTDRGFFDGDISRFDAIAFNGRNMKSTDLPKNRWPHQKYIYFNMESADNFPVCSKTFDGFFNWTSTYRLDSDIPYAYIQVRNSNGEVVGPKRGMQWLEGDALDEADELSYRLLNKTKAAAWFVSHCSSRSGRNKFVEKLQKALVPYGHTVDVYGSCGPLKCPRKSKSDCDAILERDYYFYMSLENSFAEDYVTEKLLTALQHDVVPIIYGGANYSRFLPPGSYLDGRKYNSNELAAIMNHLINNPKLYRQYFTWKYHYSFHDPSAVENVCAVCAALNDKKKMETTSVYHEFRKWWNPNFMKRC